jgi:16S rRNA (cytosine967-C5)-methyltransferase
LINSNPRRAAFDILLRIETEHSFADILIDQALASGALLGADRGLLTELVYGVLRRQGTLDHIIDQISNRKTDRLERYVHLLLRLGLYQAFFLDRVPISAAVNETVKLAKTLVPNAAGFVNAVLRNADRQRDRIVYPDKDKAPLDYLASRYSHPRWLTACWVEQLGFAGAEELARVMAEPPPITLRTNTLKISRDALLERLSAEGVQGEATRWSPIGIRINAAGSIARLDSYQEGLFTVQDESSQLAAMFLAPLPGEKVLDACAAPGGKATHLAQLMNNSGSITAGDVLGRKLRLIGETSSRLGITIIKTIVLDAAKPGKELAGQQFEKILLDAPCSGIGVIRRNPEGKWWRTASDPGALSRLQATILDSMTPLLAPGGSILYSTCSTSREENEAVVEDFLARHRNFELDDLRNHFPEYGELFTDQGHFRSWPHLHGMDGFFAARLRLKKEPS